MCVKSQFQIGLDAPDFWNRKTPSLIELICDSAAILWKEWPKDMELVRIEHGGFTLKGECPHCGNKAAFPTVTDPYHEGSGNEQRLIAVARCIACEEYIMALLKIEAQTGWVYDCHYPLGKPKDTLSEDIPAEIRTDFKEAIRAEWIKAHKATVLMCRRSLQTSCDMEKAVGNDLFTQIDDLAANQKITDPLRKMAHRIRLLGKKGAHGDYSDIDDTITPQDAEDAIMFMRHYFEHVYVLPAQLSRPSAPKSKKH